MFKVTRYWIHEHKTPAGAWTKAQIEALGLRWKDKKKGWIGRVEGRTISEARRQAFEQGREVFRPKTLKRQRAKRQANEALDRELLVKVSPFLEDKE